MNTHSFCWAQLASSDPAGSRDFYGGLFGWDQQFRLDGVAVAGVDQIEPPLAANGVPSHWRSFVAVSDVDAAGSRARELGGFAPGEPRELPGVGMIMPVFDPQGAPIVLCRPVPGGGFAGSPQAGSVALFELQARDVDKARDFYTALFGWAAEEHDGYTSFTVDGAEVATMAVQGPQWGDAPPLWLPYVGVESCDAAAERIVQLGVRVSGGPEPHPRGRRAVAHDPQDAVFGVLEPARASE
jgi:hypothetical protein